MSVWLDEIWTDETSVLFTSFWGWDPATWGTVGWSGDRGLTRQTNLMEQLSDPFITVCYVTANKTYTDPDLKGKISGFYLVSHETGDREEFTHPIHHDRDAGKWRHSNRAIRAFSYLPEYRLSVSELEPDFLTRARSISAMGEILTDPVLIQRLKAIPCEETEVYQSVSAQAALSDEHSYGMVQAGPASGEGYEVKSGSQNTPRELYILRLGGDVSAYLGRPVETRSIIKVGLSGSPDMRRQHIQKAMPRGSFNWTVDRTLRSCGLNPCPNHKIAVVGEDAMKRYLARHAEWLGSEFYLAHETDIDTAWQLGCQAVKDI